MQRETQFKPILAQIRASDYPSLLLYVGSGNALLKAKDTSKANNAECGTEGGISDFRGSTLLRNMARANVMLGEDERKADYKSYPTISLWVVCS